MLGASEVARSSVHAQRTRMERDSEVVSLEDIRRRLARLDDQERLKDVELCDLLARHADVEIKMSSLYGMV